MSQGKIRMLKFVIMFREKDLSYIGPGNYITILCSVRYVFEKRKTLTQIVVFSAKYFHLCQPITQFMAESPSSEARNYFDS